MSFGARYKSTWTWYMYHVDVRNAPLYGKLFLDMIHIFKDMAKAYMYIVNVSNDMVTLSMDMVNVTQDI
jgi:hypothetical protein